MSLFIRTISAIAFVATAAAPALASNDEHVGLADQLAIARGQVTITEGRQAAVVAAPISGSDLSFVDLATSRDAGSKR